MNILVLHGPNLNLLGERPGDEKGHTLAELDGLLRAKAAALKLAVKIFQSNHEGALLDTLHAERRWAEGVVINPGALTHTSYVLREALAAIDKPVIEVHLTDIRRRESWRRKSVIKDVCKSQVLGKGMDSYLIALERFATGDLAGRKKTTRLLTKTLGPAPKAETPVAKPAHGAERATKTLGRKAASAPPAPTPTVGNGKTLGRTSVTRSGTDILSRALVRQKIAERLSGKLTPAGLATWARARWLDVQRGAPAESGQRELLEDSLQSLVLSVSPASRLTDEQLIELMTQLEG
jgi:3-dehydroquinate dehydratase-2